MKVRTPIDLPSVNRDIGPTTLTGCGKHPQQAEVMRVLVLISATDTKRKGERKRTECRGVEVTIEPESQGSLNRKFFVY